MEKRILVCAMAALNLAVAAAACSSARGDERANGDRSSGSGDSVTVAGCLTSSQDGRFALTAAPDAAVSTAARAMSDERDTHAYVLTGGDNLQAHVGKRVEVTGTLVGKTQDMETKSGQKTEQTPAAGGDDNRPVVKTKEEIDLEARQLNVREVRDLAPTCTINP